MNTPKLSFRPGVAETTLGRGPSKAASATLKPRLEFVSECSRKPLGGRRNLYLIEAIPGLTQIGLHCPLVVASDGVGSRSGALNQSRTCREHGENRACCRRFLVTDSAADHDVPATKHVGPRRDLAASTAANAALRAKLMWNVPALQLRCRSAGRAAGRRRSGRISSEQRIGGEEVRQMAVRYKARQFATVCFSPLFLGLL